MGVELYLGCLSCSEFVWLGSGKPDKWQGFQMGNPFVAAFLALHADPCELALHDDRGEVPEDDPSWAEDLRSRGCWAGYDARGQRCGQCGAPLCEGRIVAGSLLAFCGPPCLAAHLAALTPGDAIRPGHRRVYRPTPALPPRAVLRVDCDRCGASRSAVRGPTPELCEPAALAWWMLVHRFPIVRWGAPDRESDPYDACVERA